MKAQPIPVLLLENEPGVRSVLASFLERDGFRVLQASNGRAAIELARTQAIDAFLLDIDLPDLDGVEVCKTLREIPAYRVAPILFITRTSEEKRLPEALAAGADDYIQKPVNTLILRARLRGHLRRTEYFMSLQRTREILQRYVSRRTLEIVETASRTGTIPAPQERDVVICFTDIRGFTALTEEMDATTLFPIISAVLAEQVRLVYEHGGYVDKFGGDGVMAVFDGPDRARQSCLCAIHMLEQASDHTENRDMGQLAIGIHSGRAIIGNIGSPEHLDYSVIGTTVNLAARLCGHAQPMSIIVSKVVREAVAGDCRFTFHSERQVSIRGLRQPVTVYGLCRHRLG
jgi:class 3 adenylate cyclase